MSTTMSKIMYRASETKIEAIEVDKETAKSVIIASTGQREAKNADFHLWRDTFEDAKNALIYNMEIEVNHQQRRLDLQVQTLERIKAMKETQ